MFKTKKSIIIFSIMNAVLMTVFSFLWLNNSYYLTDDEEFMIRTTTGIKNSLFKVKKKPSPDEFLFIDIAWEKQLVNEYGPGGEIIGNRPITNRKRIAQLLSHLNKKNQHKFIILDVFFKDSSDFVSDSILQNEFSKTQNILIPYHMENGIADMPIFKAPVALSDYDKSEIENNFIKFKCLYGDSIRTTPLVMYETLHGNKFNDHGLYSTFRGNLALSSFILDLRIWSENINRDQEVKSLKEDSAILKYKISYPYDLFCENMISSLPKDESRYTVEEKIIKMGLQQAMSDCSKEVFDSVAANKIIVIGDFSDTDIHETIYGATPGPLILLNIYLALREGDNMFSIWFILFLLGGFYFISYNCFRGKDIFVSYLTKLGQRVKIFGRASSFFNFISYILYFILLSVLSFFLFNIHITILLLAIYMEVLEKIVGYFHKRNNKQEIESTVN